MHEFFGTDKIAFDIVSSRFPGTPAQTRHFDRFSHALKEIIDARVWGGIHFRTADTQGAVLGRKVAHWERKHYFQPVGESGSGEAGARVLPGEPADRRSFAHACRHGRSDRGYRVH
jgi:hypothetical protein